MKPDWKDAPEWANWLALNPPITWKWFKLEPMFLGDEWVSDGPSQFAGYQHMIEKRPKYHLDEEDPALTKISLDDYPL